MPQQQSGYSLNCQKDMMKFAFLESNCCERELPIAVKACARGSRERASNEEFISKLGGALQEADESQMRLELLRDDCGVASTDTVLMEKEADELMAVMTTMINRTRGKS